jgi:AcrR family transcriptional regulator
MSYHHGDLRRALLKAAAEAITEQGVASLSMRDLARRAGVSHAAPGHHFGDKAGLLTALAAEGFEQLAKALATSRLASNSLLEMGVTYVRFAVTRRAEFEVMFRTDLHHADAPEVLAARARAADALYAGVADLPDGTRAGAASPASAATPAASPASAASPTSAAAPASAATPAASPASATSPASAASPTSAASPAASPTSAAFPTGAASRTASPARPARKGAAEEASPEVRAAGLAAWSMVHGFATLWLSGAFPDRDSDPAETARVILAELNPNLSRAKPG